VQASVCAGPPQAACNCVSAPACLPPGRRQAGLKLRDCGQAGHGVGHPVAFSSVHLLQFGLAQPWAALHNQPPDCAKPVALRLARAPTPINQRTSFPLRFPVSTCSRAHAHKKGSIRARGEAIAFAASATPPALSPTTFKPENGQPPALGARPGRSSPAVDISTRRRGAGHLLRLRVSLQQAGRPGGHHKGVCLLLGVGAERCRASAGAPAGCSLRPPKWLR
jgi:hypothetical protein